MFLCNRGRYLLEILRCNSISVNAQRNINQEESDQSQRLYPGRHSSPADLLGASVSERGRSSDRSQSSGVKIAQF